jgi:hypothetical protein
MVLWNVAVRAVRIGAEVEAMIHWKQFLVVGVTLSVACGGKTVLTEVQPGNDGSIDPVEGGWCGGCASDEDCQRNCAPVRGGVNCCDAPSGVCFAVSSAACPVSADGSVD